MLKSNEANNIIKKHGAARRVWFSPQMLIDLATLVSIVLEDAHRSNKFRYILEKEYGITIERLADIADKMRKEVDRV
jgi:hypothetical protein